MIYHDTKFGISDGLTFFREHRHLISDVKSITMLGWTDMSLAYPLKIVGDMGEIWLSSWANVPAIMRELGYPEDAIEAANSEFAFGPPNRWRPKVVQVVLRREGEAILASAEEVLEFLHKYYGENGFMPTAREILAGCDSVSSTSMAHDRLRVLQRQRHIDIQRRKHRGIVLL